MPLRLRQTCELFPGQWWERDGSHFVVTCGSTVVGPIWRDDSGGDPRWRWSISALEPGPETNGRAATRDEALAALAGAWHAWLARTGLGEIADGPSGGG